MTTSPSSTKFTLHDAVLVSDHKTIEEMLVQGHDPTKADQYGLLPIHIASIHDRSRIVRVLLSHSPKLATVTDTMAFTPLVYAVNSGHIDTVAVLLEFVNDEAVLNKALLNVRGEHACDVLRMFLAKDVDVNTADHDGRTLLMREAHINEHRLLIANGADVHRVCHTDGKTAMHFAANFDNEELIRALHDAAASVDALDSGACTPLMIAAYSRAAAAAAELVRLGADISKRSHVGDRSALHCAALHQSSSVMQALLEKASADDVNAGDRDGKTPLLIAAQHGDDALCTVLLEHGADPLLSSETGLRVIDVVAGSGSAGLMRTVCQCDTVDVNRACDAAYGETPLHLALRCGNEATARVLLEFGARAHLVNAYGEKPRQLYNNERRGPMSDELEQMLRVSEVSVGTRTKAAKR